MPLTFSAVPSGDGRWRRAAETVWVSVGSSLGHAERDHGAGERREGADRDDGGREAEAIGDEAAEDGADGVAGVAPQPVDANRPSPPRGMGDVADGGEKRRIDHGGAGAKQDRAADPGGDVLAGGGEEDAGRLHPHPARDEPLAPDTVA